MDESTEYKLKTYDQLLAHCQILLEALRDVETLTIARMLETRRKPSTSKTLKVVRKALAKVE